MASQSSPLPESLWVPRAHCGPRPANKPHVYPIRLAAEALGGYTTYMTTDLALGPLKAVFDYYLDQDDETASAVAIRTAGELTGEWRTCYFRTSGQIERFEPLDFPRVDLGKFIGISEWVAASLRQQLLPAVSANLASQARFVAGVVAIPGLGPGFNPDTGAKRPLLRFVSEVFLTWDEELNLHETYAHGQLDNALDVRWFLWARKPKFNSVVDARVTPAGSALADFLTNPDNLALIKGPLIKAGPPESGPI